MVKKSAKTQIQGVRHIFDLCQESVQTHKRLSVELTEIYEKAEAKDFGREFLKCLRFFLIKFDNSKYVDNCLAFVAKFAVAVPKEEEEMSAFLKFLFEFALKYMVVQDKGVRYRCCQLMFNLLSELIQVGSSDLDEEMWQRLLRAFLERSKDKNPRVRVQAAAGLSKLQDSEDKNCPALTALLYLMRYDPSPEVRSAALSKIRITAVSLPKIVERTLDESDVVRRTAFTVFSAKVSPKYLAIKQRNELLHNGLTDRNESVRKTCAQTVIPFWIGAFDDDVLELLRRIDLINSEKTAELTLRAIFAEQNLTEVVEKLESYFDDRRLIKELSSAKVFYWRTLALFVKEKTESAVDDVSLLDLLDRVVPTLIDLAEFTQKYICENSGSVDDSDIKKLVEYEFIALQLINLIELSEKNDEAGRRVLKEILKRLIGNVSTNHKFLAPLIKVLLSIENLQDVITWAAELISDSSDIELTMRQVKIDDDDDEVTFKMDESENNKNDLQTLIRSLTLVSEILQNVNLKMLTPTLRSLLDTLKTIYYIFFCFLVLKCIPNEDPIVRNLAFRCLALCCLLDRNLALEYFTIFLQTLHVDVETVKKTALEAIFDLLTLYGSEIVDFANIRDEAGDRKNSADGILKNLAKYLDNDDHEKLRSVAGEGFAKLLLHQRFYSPLLLSRLILLWYNPVTKQCPTLRQCIGCFLPLFAFASVTNQEALEEAFIPTMRTLFNSPCNHPLTKVDCDSVSEFMVRLTTWSYLGKSAAGKQV